MLLPRLVVSDPTPPSAMEADSKPIFLVHTAKCSPPWLHLTPSPEGQGFAAPSKSPPRNREPSHLQTFVGVYPENSHSVVECKRDLK
jgi:hypothetical protein